MISIRLPTLAACALAGSIAAAHAQTEQDHAAHHPPSKASAPAQVAPPSGAMPQSGEMRAMTPSPGMMQMMHRMMAACGGPGAGNPAGMASFRHLEGQLAFYQTELGITDAQLAQWNAFADAIRASAKKLQQAAMQQMQPGGLLPAPAQMDRRRSMLEALIDAQQAVDAPFKALYAALTDEQKSAADELLAEHLQGMRASGL